MEGMVKKKKPHSESDDSYVAPSIQRRRGYTAVERRKIMRNNVTEILSNSTLIPFRWLRKFYKCFFCQEIFKTPKEWRTHQEFHNIKAELSEALKNYWESTVNVDVTEMGCRLCSDAIADLNGLTDHLVEKHRIKFIQDIGNCLSGFKFDDTFVYCVVCEKKFVIFSHVLVHSHREHKGSTKVLCDICGQNYRSLNYLRHHIRSEHSGGIKCTQCGLLLRYTKIRTHMQNAHGRKYKCTRCHELFETQYKRAHHKMVVHGDKEMISCKYCTRKFVFNSTMTRHVRETHLRERNAECSVCGWRSFGEYALQRHMLKHTSIRNIKCPSCDKTFKTKKRCKATFKPLLELIDDRLAEKRRKDELAKLLTVILEYSTIMPFRWCGNKYMCFFCCCDFIDSLKLKQHTREEHRGAKVRKLIRSIVGQTRIKLDISEISCTKCSNTLETLDEFLIHVTEGHQVRLNQDISRDLLCFRLSDDGMSCTECSIRFRFFGPLLAHVHKYHNRASAFLCEICGQGFVAKANVDSHVRNVHSNPNARCDKCDKVFASNYALSCHYMKVHRSDKLRCPKCPEVLASRYLKKRHLALVHDVKSSQFVCEICPKVFTTKSALVQHNSRVHLKEKSVACEVCGFRVFSKELLKRHMVKHDDTRPYQCEYCKKCFQRKKTLEYHRRIHTNDRRYCCSECGKAFVQVTSLKLHLRVHHSIIKEGSQ